MNYFTFDGIDSRTYNTYIATSNAFDAPGREDEVIKVPGSNNIYYLTEGTYKPFDIKLYCYIPSNMQVKTDDLRNFLLSKGTCRYTEAIRPNEFRVARFIEAYELDVSDRVSAAFVLTFKAQPQRYLTTNTPITTTATADTTTDTTMSLSTVPTPINISLNGNTTQEGTPTPSTPQAIHNVSGDNKVIIASKNLLSNDWENDWQRGYWDISTGKFVSSRNWQAIKYYIPVQPNTTYYVYADPNISASIGNICQYDANKNFIIYKAGTKNTTFTTSANVYFLTIYVGNPYKDTNISLTESDTTTNGTYVPFTNQSYPLYLPVENLLPTFNATSGTSNGVTYSSDGSKIYLNGTSTSGVSIVFTVNGVLPSSEFYLCLFNNVANNNVAFVIDNGNTTVLSLSLGTETNRKQKYTTHYGETYTRVRVYINSAGQVFDNAVIMPMITYTPTVHYTPYGTPPIELNKIGTCQDYIYKNGGKWYVHKEFNRVDLGSLTWTYNTTGRVFYATLNPAPPTHTNTTKADAYCYKYPITTWSGKTDKSAQIFYAFVNGINIEDETYTDARTFKSSISGTELVYRIATPTNTEITDTTLINQLNNIEKAYSYNGTTNILQVSNDNGFMLEVVSLHSNDVSSTYKGEPIITVNSTGLIYFNGCVIKVNQAPMTINSQTMQAYNGVVNLNNYIEANDFPMIEAGTNVIGSEMPLSIVPNYWKL